MEELIAKKYIKALKSDFELESMQNISSLFDALAVSFKDKKFLDVVTNPDVKDQDKSELLLAAVKPANSEKINNFIQLLVSNKRVDIIPAIATELKKDIASLTKTYEGVVYSDSDINDDVLKALSKGLGAKFDATIAFSFVKNDFNGIKVEVEGLGIEINFSKDRIDNQIIEHIIKAI